MIRFNFYGIPILNPIVKGFDIPSDVPQNLHFVSVSYGVVEHPKLIWNVSVL